MGSKPGSDVYWGSLCTRNADNETFSNMYEYIYAPKKRCAMISDGFKATPAKKSEENRCPAMLDTLLHASWGFYTPSAASRPHLRLVSVECLPSLGKVVVNGGSLRYFSWEIF